MSLRLIHTADWHLGHSLHGQPRDYEHQCFLDWLLDTLQAEAADALVIAGDVFDSTNPPAAAQARFYRFLAEARRRCPALDVVVIGGNHDSAARLEAPHPLLEGLGIRVVGGLPQGGDGAPDWDRLLLPLRDAGGEVAAWCVAMPFLRPADLPTLEAGDPLIAGVAALYQEALAAARARRRPGQALLATGHCYMVGGRLSELSERKILGGHQHALPVDLFPADLAYVALGHLHRAQRVAGREHIRYSGSPIPLALDEADYRHQVLRVDLAGAGPAMVTPLPVPRAVEVLRLPEEGPRPLAEVRERLARLELPGDMAAERRPYLEVRVALERPEPGLRRAVEESIGAQPVRLLRITSHYPGAGGTLADALPEVRLDALDPEQVFALRYRQRHDGDPPEELRAAFHELLEGLQQAAAR